MKKICIVLAMLLLCSVIAVSFVGCNSDDYVERKRAYDDAIDLLRSQTETGGNVVTLDDVTFAFSEATSSIEIETENFKAIISPEGKEFSWLLVNDYGYTMAGKTKYSKIKITTARLNYNETSVGDMYAKNALRYEAAQELKHVLVVFNSYLVRQGGMSVRDLGFKNFVSMQFV